MTVRQSSCILMGVMLANANRALDDLSDDLSRDPDDLLHDRDPFSPEPSRENGRPVREFQAICAKHGLACGSPEDLAGFLRALGENKLLAMNFWSVVAKLSDGKNALDSSEVLAAIVQGVAGQSLEEASASSAQQPLVDKLARMLAGEDVPLTAEAAAVRVEPAAPETDAQPSASPPEPGIPASSPLLSAAAKPRLVLDPEHPSIAATAPHSRERVAKLEPDLPIAIPLADYAAADDDRRVPRRIAAAVLVLAIVAGGGFLLTSGYQAWRQPNNSARNGLSSFSGQVASAVDRVGAAFHAGFASARAAWKGRAAPPQSFTSEASSPQPSDDNSAAPQGASSVSQLPRGGSSSHEPLSSASPGEAGSTQADDIGAANGDSNTAQNTARIVVPGELMKEHLISSRFPIVPDAPNADRVAGLVVLEAVVMRRGNVEHIRAIEGPHALRRAAIDAASTWRYRPYLLNGTPVDVTTTIAVDFSGND